PGAVHGGEDGLREFDVTRALLGRGARGGRDPLAPVLGGEGPGVRGRAIGRLTPSHRPLAPGTPGARGIAGSSPPAGPDTAAGGGGGGGARAGPCRLFQGRGPPGVRSRSRTPIFHATGRVIRRPATEPARGLARTGPRGAQPTGYRRRPMPRSGLALPALLL